MRGRRLIGAGITSCMVALTAIFLAPLYPVTGAAAGEGPLALMYAFGAEGEILEEQMSVDSTAVHLGRRIAFGTLRGHSVVLAESGVGMTNAALTTQYLIDHHNPAAVLFSGIAGGLDSAIHVGDIVVCSTWTTHDYGYYGAEGLKPEGVDTWLPAEDSVRAVLRFRVDSALFANALSMAEMTIPFDSIGERLPRVVVGAVGVSGNTFIDSKEKRHWLTRHFEGDIVDMESAAVAQVCAVNGVPYLAFRSASDLAGGSGSETARNEIQEFFRVAARNSSLVVLRFLEEL